jgi:hypothetical protein
LALTRSIILFSSEKSAFSIAFIADFFFSTGEEQEMIAIEAITAQINRLILFIILLIF